jgi:hypothetical protein
MSAPRAFGIASVLLTLLTVNLAAPSAQAAAVFMQPIVSAPSPIFADESSVSKFLHSFNDRTRIVQLCVVVMLLALVIIIKRFHGGDASWRTGSACCRAQYLRSNHSAACAAGSPKPAMPLAAEEGVSP